jgi:hypothetical protein
MKGLGAIMATVSAMETKARVERGEAVLCPPCGSEMAFNGAAWFCRAGEHRRDGSNGPCSLEEMESRFVNPDEGRWIDDWECAVLAGVVLPGPRIAVTLRTVRGGNGLTNLSVSAEFGIEKEEVPSLIQQYGWTWAEWTGRSEGG